jgi:transcriptional regulator with XRE-family HTH domain
MNLGEKLRQLRQDRNLTQPDLADAIGIEQSYLSKLENGKYIPSSDVFGRLLEFFGLGVGEFVDDLDHGSRLQLRQIPSVASHYEHQKQLIIGNRRRWLVVSTLLLAVGASLIYAGEAQLVVGSGIYTYQSDGVVLVGESSDVFRAIFDGGARAARGIDSDELDRLRARLDEHYIQTSSYRGEIFNIPVQGGSRTYRMTRFRPVDAWQNIAVAAMGVFLLVVGGTGIFLEKKLSRFQ